MDATPALDYTALLETYDRNRNASSRLTYAISGALEDSEISEAAHRLGILRRDALVLDSDNDMSVIIDFALRHLYRDGKNAIERHRELAGQTFNSEELDAMQRMAVAHYRILDVGAIEHGVGLVVTDRLRRESGLLVDRSLSISGATGDVFAGNIVEWEGFWAGTGAALPMEDRVWARLERPIHKRFGKPGSKFRSLDQSREADLAAWCTRACLEAGAAHQVSYRLPAISGD